MCIYILRVCVCVCVCIYSYIYIFFINSHTSQRMILLHSHVDCRLVPNTCVQIGDKRVGIVLPDGSPRNIQWSVSVRYSILHTSWGLPVGCRLTARHWHLAGLPQIHFQLFKKWKITSRKWPDKHQETKTVLLRSRGELFHRCLSLSSQTLFPDTITKSFNGIQFGSVTHPTLLWFVHILK